MVAPASSQPAETRAQRDTRMESSINEHNQILHELTGRMVRLEHRLHASEERTKASFDDMKKTFSSSMDEIRYLIAAQAA